jgi:hypothetical protein
MEPNITLSLTLSIPKAEQVLAFLQKVENDSLPASGTTDTQEVSAVKLEAGSRNKLAYLLDDKLHKVIRFAVTHNGTFYNKDLAIELGVDTPLTSIYLGHLTRKLRNTGLDAKDWYTKHRTARGTVLTVRDDVMEEFREAARQ